MSIVGHVEGGREDEYWYLVDNFDKWPEENHLQLNVERRIRWW